MFKAFTYNRLNAGWAGSRDAKYDFPHANEPVSGYLGDLEKLAEDHMLAEAKTYKNKQERHKKRISDKVQERDRTGKELRETENEWKKRGIKPALPVVAHWCLVVGLFCGEFVLNEVTFRGLETRPLQTIIVTAVLGFILLGAAHLVGSWLRRPNKTRSDWTNILILTTIAFSVAAGVAWIRTNYLVREKTAPKVVSSFDRTLTKPNEVFGQPRSHVPEDQSDVQTIIFLVFQVAIFGVACYTAFESSDQVGSARRRYDNKVKALNRHAIAEEKAFERHRNKSVGWIAVAEFLQSRYMGHNVRKRKDRVKTSQLTKIAPRLPVVFAEFVPHPIPGDMYASTEEWQLPSEHRQAAATLPTRGESNVD